MNDLRTLLFSMLVPPLCIVGCILIYLFASEIDSLVLARVYFKPFFGFVLVLGSLYLIVRKVKNMMR